MVEQLCKKVFIESFGCQINSVDCDIVSALLVKAGYAITQNEEGADIFIISTCGIRKGVERYIFPRLKELQDRKKDKSIVIGVIGCLPVIMNTELIERFDVDFVAGNDSLRRVPDMVASAYKGDSSIDIELNDDEQYSDIHPLRANMDDKISANITIIRGCNNFCTYCIEPYIRGRERSLGVDEIIEEVERIKSEGYKSITLLGQNVNSYKGGNNGNLVTFAELLERVAIAAKDLRIYFLTSHPKDMSDELIDVIAKYDSIYRHIHLPVQSGSNTTLKLMNRKYSCEYYLSRVEAIRKAIPNITISSDILVGFCDESEEDHRQTLELMKAVKFDYVSMSVYSERPGTYASKRLPDNILPEIKERRLKEVIKVQSKINFEKNSQHIGKTFSVLIEGYSDSNMMYGRTIYDKMVIFPAVSNDIGTYINLTITSADANNLYAEISK